MSFPDKKQKNKTENKNRKIPILMSRFLIHFNGQLEAIFDILTND